MRRILLFALLAGIAAPASALDQVTEPAPGQTIVVTGQRIGDFRARLETCLARNCPTNEDVDATLALAEALFLNGEYADARSAVRASIGRNREHRAVFPEPVSDLYRADTRLARHIGLDREARTSAFEILRSLQAGLPTEDHRHFTARLEIAEIQMMSGNYAGAQRELERLTRVARAAGREDVATIAELRDRWYTMVALPGGGSLSELIAWSQSTAPADRMRAIGARILLARFYRLRNDHARADALLAEIGQANRHTERRRLLSAPRYQLFQQEVQADGDYQGEDVVASNVLTRFTENYEDKWIDVGFWVMPDGSVQGLEVLRSGANPDWAPPLLESIRGRRYSEWTEPSYKLERYTMTARFETVTGSHIRTRSPAARVEMLDLTANAPEVPLPSASN